jgi:hypothetical protein
MPGLLPANNSKGQAKINQLHGRLLEKASTQQPGKLHKITRQRCGVKLGF